MRTPGRVDDARHRWSRRREVRRGLGGEASIEAGRSRPSRSRARSAAMAARAATRSDSGASDGCDARSADQHALHARWPAQRGHERLGDRRAGAGRLRRMGGRRRSAGPRVDVELEDPRPDQHHQTDHGHDDQARRRRARRSRRPIAAAAPTARLPVMLMIWATKSASDVTRPRIRGGVSDCIRYEDRADRVEPRNATTTTRPIETHQDRRDAERRHAERAERPS